MPASLPGLTSTAPQVGISPDGRTLAFVASQPGGLGKLSIRPLDSSTSVQREPLRVLLNWPARLAHAQ